MLNSFSARVCKQTTRRQTFPNPVLNSFSARTIQSLELKRSVCLNFLYAEAQSTPVSLLPSGPIPVSPPPAANAGQPYTAVGSSGYLPASPVDPILSTAPTANSGHPATPTANSGHPATPTANSGQPLTPTANSGQPSTPTANSGQPSTPTANSDQPSTQGIAS